MINIFPVASSEPQFSHFWENIVVAHSLNATYAQCQGENMPTRQWSYVLMITSVR